MKLTFKQSVLSIVCALALAACGGGGSSKPSVNSNPNNPNNPPAPAAEMKADQFSKALNDESFTVEANGSMLRFDAFGSVYNGALIAIDNKTGEVKSGHTAENKKQDFENFTINGTKVLLLASAEDKRSQNIGIRALKESDFPDGGFNPKDTKNPSYIGSIGESQSYGRFSAMRFGVYTDANNISHLFVHGNPNTNMTTSGSVTYVGSAVYGKNGSYEGLDGKVRAVANFDTKNIDVTIDLTKAGGATDKLEFGGQIKGNTFAGEKNGIETRGGFFGYYDLAGVYQVKSGDKKGYNGAFGATESR